MQPRRVIGIGVWIEEGSSGRDATEASPQQQEANNTNERSNNNNNNTRANRLVSCFLVGLVRLFFLSESAAWRTDFQTFVFDRSPSESCFPCFRSHDANDGRACPRIGPADGLHPWISLTPFHRTHPTTNAQAGALGWGGFSAASLSPSIDRPGPTPVRPIRRPQRPKGAGIGFHGTTTSISKRGGSWAAIRRRPSKNTEEATTTAASLPDR